MKWGEVSLSEVSVKYLLKHPKSFACFTSCCLICPALSKLKLRSASASSRSKSSIFCRKLCKELMASPETPVENTVLHRFKALNKKTVAVKPWENMTIRTCCYRSTSVKTCDDLKWVRVSVKLSKQVLRLQDLARKLKIVEVSHALFAISLLVRLAAREAWKIRKQQPQFNHKCSPWAQCTSVYIRVQLSLTAQPCLSSSSLMPSILANDWLSCSICVPAAAGIEKGPQNRTQ